MQRLALFCVLALVISTAFALETVSKCEAAGGACANTLDFTCSVGFVSGKCPGSNNIKCCTGKLAARNHAATASSCSKSGGVCGDKTKNTCSTGFLANMCPGSTNIQCCKGSLKTKSTVKKPAVKKPTTAKKPATKKPATKKPATKKPATKKPATKKPATKKPATKKPTSAKKPTSKPSTHYTYEAFKSCYPLGDGNSVKESTVGLCSHGWITNTCAVRMSHTFNCAAQKLNAPQLKMHFVKDETVTACKGKLKGQNIIFRTKQLEPLIKTRLGKPLIFKGTGSDGRGVALKNLQNRKGIIYFDTTGAWDDATGHFDVWTGSEMYSKQGPESDATTQRFFSLAKAIHFWPLK